MITDGKMGTAPGSIYLGEEEGSGMSISGCRGLCLPTSFFLLRRGLDNPISSSHGGRDTSRGMLVLESHLAESQRGSESVVSQKERACSPDGSLRKLWILGSFNTGPS